MNEWRTEVPAYSRGRGPVPVCRRSCYSVDVRRWDGTGTWGRDIDT